jgi:chromosome segregation ATPase
MPIDENFLLTKIMDLSESVAKISGKIDGFMQSQSAQQAEINGLKTRISSTESDIVDIKATHSTVRNRLLGASAICSAAAAAFMTFGWPILQKKFGL